MAETLRELLVALSPDSSNFSCNMCTIHHAKADLNSFVWVIWFTLF